MTEISDDTPQSKRQARIERYQRKLLEQQERERQVQDRKRYLASARAHKDDTRRRMLLGKVMLAAMEEDLDEAGREVIHELLDRRLKRDKDRSLFGLPPLKPPDQGPPASAARHAEGPEDDDDTE